MGFFRKGREFDRGLINEIDYSPISFEQALEYLIGLSDKEFDQTFAIAETYRKADQAAAEALGTEKEPRSFINPPTGYEEVPPHINHVNPKNILDDDYEGASTNA